VLLKREIAIYRNEDFELSLRELQKLTDATLGTRPSLPCVREYVPLIDYRRIRRVGLSRRVGYG
jgi:hypothetical protein